MLGLESIQCSGLSGRVCTKSGITDMPLAPASLAVTVTSDHAAAAGPGPRAGPPGPEGGPGAATGEAGADTAGPTLQPAGRDQWSSSSSSNSVDLKSRGRAAARPGGPPRRQAAGAIGPALTSAAVDHDHRDRDGPWPHDVTESRSEAAGPRLPPGKTHSVTPWPLRASGPQLQRRPPPSPSRHSD